VTVTACAPERSISLTFDDATLSDGPILAGTERTERLIDTLAKAGVSEAMFFLTTGNVARVGDSGPGRIAAYATAGHALGNHSHSHLWYWQTPTDDYIADLDLAIENLQRYDNVKPYYRFPFLDEGRSLEKRDAFREALKARGLHNGYVTVDTYDWYLDRLVQEALAAGIEFDIDDLRALYVDVIVSSTEFYDAMAQKTLGRSPHHVLLLHENDLAAMFAGDLVAALRKRGFRIIPATEAFRDSIAAREPDTLYLGQGRVAALAHEAGWNPADLVSPTEDEDYLRRRFEAEVVELPES
jgi:peptidoglycan/xylan/chitin deacetylase (PgdA/CDA1 family)